MSQVTRSADAATDIPASQTTNLTPSIGRRMASWFYEGLLMFGVVFIAGYFVQHFEPNPPCIGQPTRLTSLPICGLCDLLHVVLAQGSNLGNENLAHSRG